MDVEAGVAQLSDLLGQELHPLSGVTEDNRLVDLKLCRREEFTKNNVLWLNTSTLCPSVQFGSKS